MKPSERQVHTIFDGFTRKLDSQKSELQREIEHWRSAQIRLIDDHVREQSRLLQREYEKQRSLLNGTRQQFIDATQPYERTGNNEQIDLLLA